MSWDGQATNPAFFKCIHSSIQKMAMSILVSSVVWNDADAAGFMSFVEYFQVFSNNLAIN